MERIGRWLFGGNSSRFTAFAILFLVLGLVSRADEFSFLEDYWQEENPSESTLEFLRSVYPHKMDLNSANRNELLQFPWLTPEDVRQIIEQRPYSNWEEFIRQTQLEAKTIALLQPFCQLKSKPFADWETHGKWRWYRRIDRGDEHPHGLIQWQQWKDDHWEINGQWQKDPHEKTWSDFASGNIGWQQDQWRIIGGDYRLGFGQGLLFHPSHAMFMVGNLTRLPENDLSQLRLHHSSEENRFLRGLAGSFSSSSWTFTAFSSWDWKDASLKEGIATSLGQSGVHSSSSSKDKICQKLMGCYGGNSWLQGCAVYRKYHIPLENIAQNGCEYSLAALYPIGNYQIWGEWARDANRHQALLGGIMFTPPQKRLLFMARHYDRHFHTYYGSSPSFFGRENETGFYMAYSQKIQRHLSYQLAHDFAYEPQLSDHFPLERQRQLLEINYGSSAHLWSVYLKREEKEELWENQRKQHRKMQIRLSTQQRLQPTLHLHLRSEWMHLNFGPISGSGWLLWQQIVWKQPQHGRQWRLKFVEVNIRQAGEIYAGTYQMPGLFVNERFTSSGRAFYLTFQQQWKNRLISFFWEQKYLEESDYSILKMQLQW